MPDEKEYLYRIVLNLISDYRLKGNWRRLSDMGLSRKQVEELWSLSLGEVKRTEQKLDSDFVSIRVDGNALSCAIKMARVETEANKIRDELIARDAPVEMMTVLYGLGGRDYARLRRVLNVPAGAGRPAETDEATASKVWGSWESIRPTSAHLKPTKPEEWIRLSDETGISVRTIWRLVKKHWDNQGTPPDSRPPAPLQKEGGDEVSADARATEPPHALDNRNKKA